MQGLFRLKLLGRDFPGGPVVRSPPSNAGDAGSIPSWGTRVPHAREQLGLHATATEPANCNGKPMPSGTHVPQLERSLRARAKDPLCHC